MRGARLPLPLAGGLAALLLTATALLTADGDRPVVRFLRRRDTTLRL